MTPPSGYVCMVATPALKCLCMKTGTMALLHVATLTKYEIIFSI